MTDQLINKLTDDLKPVCPCCPYGTSMKLTLLAVVGGIGLIYMIGLRPDFQESLLTMMPYWKSGIFALIGLGAALTLCRLGLPGRGSGVVGPAMMTMGTAGLIAFILGALAFTPDVAAMIGGLAHLSKGVCLTSVTTLGLVLMICGGFLLKKLAFMQPRLAGTLLGIASGSFAAAAYAWHCNSVQPLYVGVWYGLPVLALGLLGFALGQRIFRL
jgi:hypothetical protein